MWYLISLENSDKKYVLLGEKSYVVGRRDCAILLGGDPTVSRKHAELTMSHPEANLTNVNKLPVLLLKDLSKFGTWVNKEKISGEKILSDGDEIMFGSDKSMYTVVYEPLVITSSCLDNAGKKLIRHQLCILGGHMVNEWSSDCSLVVMNKISVTIKVICALVSLKSIVLPGYLQQYVKHLQGTSEKPDPAAFTPELGETQLDPSEVSFAPDNRRKTLFQGMKFVFLSQKQLKKLNQAVELGGGMTLLMETGGDDGILTEQGTIVMDCQETDVTPKAEKWAKHVLGLLDRKGKHMIQDAEIGYAVLYCSTEKHCNPDYTTVRDLSKLPSQSLSQVDVFVANKETQNRTQTQGKTQRTAPSTKSQQQKTAKLAKSSSPDPTEQRKSSCHSLSHSPSPTKPSSPPAQARKSTRRGHSPSPEKTSSPPTETRKSTRRGRSSSPAKPSSPGPSKRQRTGRHGRSPSSDPKIIQPCHKKQETVMVKEEPISQPQPSATSKKRNRPVIEEDSSDEEFPVPHGNRGNKRFKVEPETPRPKTGTVEKQKNPAIPDFAADSDDNDSDNVDEFDKIDARMRSRRKQTSAKGQSQRSPSVSPRVSPVRQTGRNNRRSSSPIGETGSKTNKKVKAEVPEERPPSSDHEPSSSRRGSNKGQARSVENTSDESVAGGSRSGTRKVRKTEVESNDFQMSSVIPVEDLEDVKPAVVNGTPLGGFLTTRKPIEDQVPRNCEFQVEPDQPSNCIKVEFESLVARKPPAKVRDTMDCPDGFTRWKGKVVKNFKKFRKVHPSGQVGLPTVIGGSDLEVYVPHRSKEMDDWFRETMQAESQHASEERRAQELFDFDPSRRRGR